MMSHHNREKDYNDDQLNLSLKLRRQARKTAEALIKEANAEVSLARELKAKDGVGIKRKTFKAEKAEMELNEENKAFNKLRRKIVHLL